MKRLFGILLLTTALWSNEAKAQCPFDNTFYIDMTPAFPGDVVYEGCTWPGDLITLNVVAGETYAFWGEFNLLLNDDLQFTLYNAAGTVVLDVGDDEIANQPVIYWTATYTGTANLLVDFWEFGIFSCSHNSTNCNEIFVSWIDPTTNTNCDGMDPICTNVGLNFNAQASGLPANPNNNYDCLSSQPDPTWYYFEIGTSGNIDMQLSAASDIDYAIWGPFADLTAAQGSCGTLGIPIDCSYSGLSVELPSIAGAVAGEVYIMLITNYAGVAQTISLTQTGGTGGTTCSILCAADAGTVTTTLSNSTANNYSLCVGDNIAIDADLNAVMPPSPDVPGLGYAIYACSPTTADPDTDPCFTGYYWTGGNFTDFNGAGNIFEFLVANPLGGYAAVSGTSFCMVPITMDDIATIAGGGADDALGHDVDGDGCFALGTPVCIDYLLPITFAASETCAPNTLTVTISGGYPGVNGGASYMVTNTGSGSITQTGAQGQTITITGYTTGQTLSFDVTNDGNTCTASYSLVTSCAGCSADVGTFTILENGNPTTSPIFLCTSGLGDCFSITSNDDYVLPLPVVGETSEVMFAIYSCPPSGGAPDLDPCYTGLLWTAEDITDCNNAGGIILGAGLGPDVYLVPITMDDSDNGGNPNGVINWDNDGDGCFDMGSPVQISFLSPITATSTVDPCTGITSITISGGMAAYDASNYTIVNTGPGSVSGGPITSGGSVTVSGLSNGDVVSLLVSDSEGCSETLTFAPTLTSTPTISGNAPICVGATVQLTGSGTPDPTTPWSSSNPAVATVSNSGLVSGSTGGSVTITYTNNLGCQNTVVVTVNPTPTISGNAPICIGTTVQLTGSGTPDPTTPWTSSNPAVATVSNAGLVDGLTAGSSTITYLDANGCQNTVVVTVNPTPTISGNSPTCIGSTVQLTGSGTPDPTTPWTSSNPLVATISNTGLVDGLTAGSSTITYLDANGCQNTVVVTVNAAPTISGNAPICLGATVQLTGSGTPEPTTPWASSNPAVATVSNTGLVSGLTGGTSTITYTNDLGCQNTVIVTVNPTPTISGNSPTCIGSTLQLTGSGAPDPTTPWTSSNPAVATVSNTGLVTGLTAGTSTLTYLDANGCQNSVVVTINTTATILGNAPICIAATLQLTGSGIPDLTTPWTSSNPAVATVSNTGLVSGITAGTSTITYMDVNGCQNTEIVTVSATATISGNAPICVGSTVQLTGSGTPDPTTPWSSSNPAVATVSNTGLVTGIAGGTSTISYLDANGCQNTVVATVNDNPTISGSTPICVGTTVQLTGSGTPDPTTPWASSNPAMATVSNTGLVTGIAAGSSTITYLDANGCQNTIVVTVNATPTISGSAPLCLGSTVQLNGSAIPDPTTPWTSSNPAVATVDNTGLVTAAAVGSTTVTYLNSNGCQATVTVAVNANPVISTAQTPVSACGMNDGVITISDAGGASGTMNWSGTASGSASGVTLPYNINGLAPGTYDVIFTDNSTGCTSISSQEIFSNPVGPTVDDQVDVEQCDSYTLPAITGTNLSGLESYWTGSGGTGTQYLAGTIITATSTLFIYDMNGACSDEQLFTITIHPSPAIDPMTDVTVCGSYALPAIEGVNLSGNESYYNDTQLAGGMVISGTLTNSQTVWVYDELNGCSEEISFLVTINPVPNVLAVSGGGTYCEGDPIANVVAEVDGSASWTIDFTLDGVAMSATGASSPVSLGNQEGIYVLTAVSDAGCSNTASGSETIVINPYPNAPLAGVDATYCSTAGFDLMTASGSGGELNWYMDQALTNHLAVGGQLKPSNNVGVTSYYITETLLGCEGQASEVVITVEECPLLVPTAFTPDNDTKNDYWNIQNLDMAYPNNEVFVYNRWGSLIYSSEKGKYEGRPWDGKFNGTALPVGSYYFILKFNDEEGGSDSGTVTIILND